ncbi:MAG: hypothetical protein KJO07_12355, partial [Deltaproteobacteria bacterium]|nr:hypothetical protein [Deltaproteobacteria bacterium]
MTAAQTYPGTVTPLRGLLPFGEADRDVFFGRDEERDELTRLVIGEGFRAGLLYGQSGVGKTSLLRSGLLPHLRDQGVFALLCTDLEDPVRSFATAMLSHTGAGNREGEAALEYLERVVSEAMQGQLFLFVVDGLEQVLDGSGELLAAFAELYQRVVSRSGGRARFLFSCAADKVYALGALERKTGSLFPPSNRFELKPLSVADATLVLDRTVALAGLTCDPSMPQVLAEALGPKGRVLPADLQIAALAIRDLALRSPPALEELGGADELLRSWLIQAATVTGDERAALRVIGELAHGDGLTPQSAPWVAARANVDPAFAQHALASLQASVVVEGHMLEGMGEPSFSLAHPIIAVPAREISAPAREAARRAFELLGSKAEGDKGRLTLLEWWQLRREGISPATPQESAVVARTKRFFTIVFGAIGAAPILLLILLYVALSGQFYLDVGRPAGGGKKTVVVRKGRPGLSAFFWLPASPGYGEIIADTGFTEAMVQSKRWKQVADADISGSDDGMAYAKAGLKTLNPLLAGLLSYATTGKEEFLTGLIEAADTPEKQAQLLTELADIARGGGAELELLSESLRASDPSVQTAALQVISSGMRRNPSAFEAPMLKALQSENVELRRLAVAAVRGLPGAQASKLAAKALDEAVNPEVRSDLAAIGGAAKSSGPSAAAAATELRDRSLGEAAKNRARSELERAMTSAPEAATRAAAALAADADAPPEHRVYALVLLYERAPESLLPELRQVATDAKGSKAEEVEAAALPLYARVDPSAAAGDLALMKDQKDSAPVRAAIALAWGEVAKKDRNAAITALDAMLADSSPEVRRAAARAFGYTGKNASQAKLIKMVKTQRYDVAIGAAYGLANSAIVGGSSGNAVGGIYDLWKRKGKPRRNAAEVYSYMARHKPGPVMGYLVASVRARDDSALHPIGAQGLCNAYNAGHRRAARELSRTASDEDVRVRRIVVQCLVDTSKELGKTELATAARLARDSDSTIRADAARILAGQVKPGETSAVVRKALARLAQDKSRIPRMTAIRAFGKMQTDVPEDVLATLPLAFRGAPESDKL